eukprot:2523386-Rhodomonas_salina.2
MSVTGTNPAPRQTMCSSDPTGSFKAHFERPLHATRTGQGSLDARDECPQFAEGPVVHGKYGAQDVYNIRRVRAISRFMAGNVFCEAG